MTTKQFIEKATQLHNGKYDYSKTEYITSRDDVIIICPKHGEFKQRAVTHLQGFGCPKCARIWSDERKQNHIKSSRRHLGMTTDEWIERAKLVHGDKYDYSQVVYVNQRTNVKIICPVHGMFEQKADSHLRGHGCRLCGLQSENRKGVHNWSEEQHEKIQATCMERYGAPRYLDSNIGKEKISQIKSDPEFRQKMREIISSDEVQEKTKRTSLERYGVDYPSKTTGVQNKIYKTKKKNHKVNSSQSEMKMYELLVSRFGKNDVIHQYKADARYPFICDFYIPSLDLFIELNASWTHGGHWFGECKDDNDKLTMWQEKMHIKNSAYYKAAIYTWTVRDLMKRQTAIDNHINYVVFWKTDLSDFKKWFKSDELILNNIL